MKLVIFNGSPRGEKGNTKILLEHFLRGFMQTPGNLYEEYYLLHTREHEYHARIFNESEAVLLAFPLYTDAMPGIVKAFIEELAPYPESPQPESRPKLLFLVQSGFPEAIHLETLGRYLAKLAGRLGYECPGVIIKGGVEGIQIMPPKMTRKLFHQMFTLGESFGRTGSLDSKILEKMRSMKRFPLWIFPVLYLMKWFGLMDFYWNQTLKENNAFSRRFDRPYPLDSNQ
jgi:hypothetical protein